MDKKDFVIKNKDNIKFNFISGFIKDDSGNRVENRLDIEILSYIPQNVKLELAKNYVETISITEDVVNNYYAAEWKLICGILEACSNVDYSGENFENIMSSGLWDEIKIKIINYNELRNEIRAILNQRSVEGSFNKIANKVIELIDNVSKMDMSKEGIEKLVGGLQSVVGDFQEKFPTSVAKVPKIPKKRTNKDSEQ
jgi:hypothetical protein